LRGRGATRGRLASCFCQGAVIGEKGNQSKAKGDLFVSGGDVVIGVAGQDVGYRKKKEGKETVCRTPLGKSCIFSAFLKKGDLSWKCFRKLIRGQTGRVLPSLLKKKGFPVSG